MPFSYLVDMETAQYWINRLALTPHPEGGYYKEIFRSGIDVIKPGNAKVYQACTSIYYLLAGSDISAFHRLPSDEIWYFHKGQPIHIHAINLDLEYDSFELSDTATGELSVVIPAGWWFAAELPSKKDFALVSCAVAPGFEFNEFEMGEKRTLIGLMPKYRTLFERLCKL